ncbi:MAG: hypothetical protein PT954_05080 [Eubacteriales bacterium]|nr:hypothetical protein [Eubacteriales bacterium]
MLLSYIRDFVPPFYFGLAVTLWRGRYADAVASSTAPRGFGVLAVRLFTTCSRRIERGRYEDAVASSTVPRGFGVLAVRLFGLAVGGFLSIFYKESTLFL